MANNKNEGGGDGFLIGLGALLFGVALAQPSKEQTDIVKEYKSKEQLFHYFKQNYHEFHDYLRDRKLFEEYKYHRLVKNKRWQSLGNPNLNQNINNYPVIRDFFNDAVKMYLEGFFRNSCISCAIVIEALLKKKFGEKRLVQLIDEAENSQIINRNDKHYLHGIRLDRNDYVHTINDGVAENDAKIVILITGKIINKIV